MHLNAIYNGLALTVGPVSAIPVPGEWVERGEDKATYTPAYFYSYNNPKCDVAVEGRNGEKATYFPAYFYSYNNPKRDAAPKPAPDDVPREDKTTYAPAYFYYNPKCDAAPEAAPEE
jgi:hypothetical protein